jgi:hypothetical protein
MKTRNKTLTSRLGRFSRTGLLAVAVTAILGGSAIAPAFANEWRHGGGGDVREQEWRDHDRFEHRHHVYVAPRFGYAGRDYYRYAPAPVYAVPSLHLGFGFR